MARIPESEIERLKLSVSLVRLVESAGVVLKAHGKDRIGRCPFHDDKTPSLVVSPKTNLWHCLGACQAGGSVIDWVMRCEGVSFREAVERLRDLSVGAFNSSHVFHDVRGHNNVERVIVKADALQIYVVVIRADQCVEWFAGFEA